MSAIVYPVTLPGPTAAPFQPGERRLLSTLPGPRQSRPMQRDRKAVQQLDFVFSHAELAIFEAWLDADLVRAGAWFASSWPQPQGGVGVRRFIGEPSHPIYYPTYGWHVSAEVEVRGRGMLPTIAIAYGFNPSPAFFYSARWVLTEGNTRATVPPGAGTLTHTRSFIGRADKRYFEAVTSANNGVGEDALVGLMNQYFPYTSRLGDLYINAGGEGVDPLAHSCSYNISGQVQKDAVLLDTIDAYAVGVVAMIAFDGATGHVWFGNDGVFDGDPAAGTGWNVELTPDSTYFVGVGLDNNGSASNLVDWQGHFITSDMAYPPPAGFIGWDD